MPIRRTAVQFCAPFALAVVLAGCSQSEEPAEETQTAPQPEADDNYADEMRSDDSAAASPDVIADSEERPVMQAQVILDRMGFSPGVIDGQMGMSTENALLAFQEANGLTESGELDDATRAALLGSTALSEQGPQVNADGEIENTPQPTATAPGAHAVPATRVVTIPESFAVGRYEAIPDDAADQAEMTRLGYESLDEKLAERFHTTVDTLMMLNPDGQPAGAKAKGEKPAAPDEAEEEDPNPTDDARPGPKSHFKAGQQIRVPNIGADFIDANKDIASDWRDTLRTLGVGSEQPHAARIVVDKSDDTLIAYDEDGKIIAAFTVSSGSSHDPLPIGDWKILGVAHNPPFAYDPTLFWDVPDTAEKQQLPPGPNGPVGVVWIDLSKEHYGIHGTSEPQTIGRAQSHGCVRLTNWDAARLAEMVDQSTEVHFQK
ncbi:L,D-transpeptidase family protein [Croceicoccus mobilis]|uniref:Peptidoglycan-binding protein n=1 Tax=Croceicoccus mobilis TaxID=1703339 RepID=A0A916Z562_9SPHN|nr:L,D-transpeptidase family protein [Croceicoccus mobilis]GGD76707.1 peptidoglycan-binding protein [Croceicoccus mobilis]